MDHKKTGLRQIWGVFKNAFQLLMKNQPLQMAAATAFFTTFALPSILIIITQLAGLLIDPDAMRQQLTSNLSGIIGNESIDTILDVMKEMKSKAGNWYFMLGGFLFLLFVATTLFKVIKNSINQIWKLKPTGSQGFGKKLKGRLPSLLVILGAGLLFLVGMLLESFQTVMGRYVDQLPSNWAIYLNNVFSYIVSLVIVTLWFTILFRYIPDARAAWPAAFAGGLLTSFLFSLGKVLLQRVLLSGDVSTVYGASSSIVLLLLFVFYSSFLLYYGAAFLKSWADFKDQPIKPMPHTVYFEIQEVESDKA